MIYAFNSYSEGYQLFLNKTRKETVVTFHPPETILKSSCTVLPHMRCPVGTNFLIIPQSVLILKIADLIHCVCIFF